MIYALTGISPSSGVTVWWETLNPDLNWEVTMLFDPQGRLFICLSICCSNVLTFHGTSAPQSPRFCNYDVLVHVSLGFGRAEIKIIGCNLSRGGPARLETVVVWCIINVQMFTWTGVWSYDDEPMFRSRLLAPCFSDEVLLCACQT